MDEISALLQEDRRFPPSDAWRRDAIARDPAVYARAAADPEAFWAAFAGELEWITPWSRILEWNPPYAKWFVGGTLNASVNCLDRHIRGPRRNKAAFIWEGEPGDRRTLTYWDLYRQVNAFASVLKSLGVTRGDRVALYLPLIPELAIAMLACARYGAVHSVVFGGFTRSRCAIASTTRSACCSSPPTADTAAPVVPKQMADEAPATRRRSGHVVVVRHRAQPDPVPSAGAVAGTTG
jgi:acetyl-CoA synthetase